VGYAFPVAVGVEGDTAAGNAKSLNAPRPGRFRGLGSQTAARDVAFLWPNGDQLDGTAVPQPSERNRLARHAIFKKQEHVLRRQPKT
jgi:hypothetical protein